MITLIATIWLMFTICDALLLYTYFAITSANMQTELNKIFVEQNGFLFIFNNLIHSVLIAFFFKTLNPIFFILLILSISIYLFPKAIEKILKIKIKKFAK